MKAMDGMEVTFEAGLCDGNYGDLRFLREMNPRKLELLMDLTMRPLKDGHHERKSRLFPLLRCHWSALSGGIRCFGLQFFILFKDHWHVSFEK